MLCGLSEARKILNFQIHFQNTYNWVLIFVHIFLNNGMFRINPLKYPLNFIPGVAQGSKISPTLCHLYLGHMERTKVPDVFSDPDSLLMRWIDDPLLSTYNSQLAKRYLTAMLEEDSTYKCKINVEKCLVNFVAVTSTGEQIKKLSDEETLIPWCSLLINKTTLDVRFD